MKTVTFIIATQKSTPQDTVIYDSIQKLSKLYDIQYTFYTNNKIGLGELYQQVLDNNNSNDILVFVHDDVILSDINIIDKLIHYSSQFNVMGVAGSKVVDITGSSLICWHNSPKSSWAGYVIHPSKQSSQYYCTAFGPAPTQVATIDGLFIAVDMEVCKNLTLFDKNFKFHFYDMDFSLTCYTNQLKIGVINTIIQHNSHGDGLLSEEYKIIQERFLEKWKKQKK